jgi:hypothetical protein
MRSIRFQRIYRYERRSQWSASKKGKRRDAVSRLIATASVGDARMSTQSAVTEDAQMSVTTTASNIIAPTQVWAITDAY